MKLSERERRELLAALRFWHRSNREDSTDYAELENPMTVFELNDLENFLDSYDPDELEEPHIVITGDPRYGFNFYGPCTEEEANRLVEGDDTRWAEALQLMEDL